MTSRSTARSVPFIAVALLGLLALRPGAARAADGDPTLQERVAALKQSLAESQKALRTYQWVETTTVSMKGEVKSQKQMSCYYGADGALQKQPLSARDYQLAGDTLAITLDPATNRLAGIQVTTYLDKPSNPVDLKVTMGTLADGTVYSASTQLEVKAEKVAVNIANTGYKHAN